METKNRISHLRQKEEEAKQTQKTEDVTVVESAHSKIEDQGTSLRKTSRSDRFRSAGEQSDVSDEQELLLNGDNTEKHSDEPVETSAAVNESLFHPVDTPKIATLVPSKETVSRKDRFNRIQDAIKVRESSEAVAYPDPVKVNSAGSTANEANNLPWLDDSRPAGSKFSVEEWEAAEKLSPDHVVYEMQKSDECGLIYMSKEGVNWMYQALFTRSRVIHSMARCEWKSKADIKIEHTGEFGLFKYDLIRSEDQKKTNPWIAGSKLSIPPKEDIHKLRTVPDGGRVTQSRREKYNQDNG